MNNKHEQRLEELEEVLQRTLNKVKELENRKIELPTIPDYTLQFSELKEGIARHNLAYPAVKIQTQILELQKNIDAIPKRIPIQHYYHFTDRSKGSIIAGIILLISCALSVGIAISLWKENRKLNDNSVKFRMIRQSYPNISHWADTIYNHDPKAMERLTKRLEDGY
ncbi:hypothetical protein [Daejeonella sp. JGW-45]|uniref:hypothetical protein n=1 Tax=Daejeonella sp. JGW-45 TaxID=3034148 RepID=UPI0023EE0093|nr:hypothetical protein [Daejeonella sp. JGW-45]